MSIEYDAIFLFQAGVGIIHMILGTLLFINILAFYYLAMGIYPAVICVLAGVLLLIWVYGNKEGDKFHVYLKFVSADQITSYMQPLFTVVVLNAFLSGIAFYIYTVTPVAPFNSGFSVLVFSVGAMMFAHAKIPPKSTKFKKETEKTPLVVNATNYQSYDDNVYKITESNLKYPNNGQNAVSMESRNIAEGAWSL